VGVFPRDYRDSRRSVAGSEFGRLGDSCSGEYQPVIAFRFGESISIGDFGTGGEVCCGIEGLGIIEVIFANGLVEGRGGFA